MESYFSLFLSAFLAATIIPFSSEALLGVMVASDTFDTLALFAVASIGNTMGSVVNWTLGRFCMHWQNHRRFPFKADDLERASDWFNRYGKWSLLLAWLPIVGDPLTFIAGVLRVPFLVFLILVFISKASRYLVILGLVEVLWT